MAYLSHDKVVGSPVFLVQGGHKHVRATWKNNGGNSSLLPVLPRESQPFVGEVIDVDTDFLTGGHRGWKGAAARQVERRIAQSASRLVGALVMYTIHPGR
jgi:hypothetical protein